MLSRINTNTVAQLVAADDDADDDDDDDGGGGGVVVEKNRNTLYCHIRLIMDF